MYDELTGTYVMVHPDLRYDPDYKIGQIGMITYASPETDDFYVEFYQGERSIYPASALLVLKPKDRIFYSLMNERDKMSPSGFKDLFRVNLLQETARHGQLKDAFEIVLKNPYIWRLAMQTMEDRLELNQTLKYGR